MSVEACRELIGRCLSECGERDWRKVLRERVGERSSEFIRDATDPTQADWQFLVPMTTESRVLDVAAGWGAVAFALAPRCHKVFAMESAADYLRFMRLRKEQDGVSNLEVVEGDFCRLPFETAAMDVVICSDVLRRTGRGRRPRRALLKELARVLEPKGTLVLGSETRFARGVRPLLQEAGFSDVRVYAARRSHRRPWTLIPLDELGPRLSWIRRQRRWRRWAQFMRACGLGKLDAWLRNRFASHVVVIARKGSE